MMKTRNWLSTYMGPRNTGWVGGACGWNQPTQEFVDQYEEAICVKTNHFVRGGRVDGKSIKPHVEYRIQCP